MPKRSPTMLDLLPRHSILPYRPEFRAILAKAPVARQYVFDAAASQRVGEFFKDNLDLVIDNLEFARAPFPTTYIEIDSEAMWAGWRPDQQRTGVADKAVGFLIDGDTVMVLARDEVSAATPEAVSIGFRINRPQSIPLDRLTGYSDDRQDTVKQAFVLGGQRYVSLMSGYDAYDLAPNQEVNFPTLPAQWTPAQVAAHFDVKSVFSGLPASGFVGTAFLGGGDPILAVIALLLLNQPTEIVRLDEVSAARGIFRGKLKTYRAHYTVTIDLAAKPKIVRDWSQSDRASPLVHDVEGHWKNYNRFAGGCEHQWEPVGPEKTISGDYKRYWCPHCLQRRTWTDAFVRGDALRGVATRSYTVTR